MTTERIIPIPEIRVGDFFRARMLKMKPFDSQDFIVKTCQLVEDHGPILRVKANRAKLTEISRKQIVGLAWRNL